MKIRAVEAIPFRIPMREKVSFATGSLSDLEHVLVVIRTDDGRMGVGEAPARPMVYGETQQSIVAAVMNHLAPAIVGEDVFRLSRIFHATRHLQHNPTAKSAVEIALVDLMAQSAGVPCNVMLGGWSDSIGVLHILGIGEPEKIAEDAVSARETLGLNSFKLKAGMDPERDTLMLRAVREALGPAARLVVDCNHGYDGLTAARLLPRWEEFDIDWVEEPCPGLGGHSRSRVAQDTKIPIMADESATDLASVMRELETADCRLFSIKTARTGYSQSRAIREICAASGVFNVVGSQGDTGVGTLASLHFACSHPATADRPAELSFFLEAADDLLVESPKINGGFMNCPDVAGLGAVIDEDKLSHYRVDR